MIKYTVDNVEHSAPKGTKMLEALLREGFDIPHLCHDPRFHAANKSCGLCVVKLENADRIIRSCSTVIEDGMVITTESNELDKYRKIRMEQLLEDHNADCIAPCEATCPAGIDIQLYLKQAASGNIKAALKTIKEKNPFPSVCGRVCPHPCEAECRRNLVDEPININGVKRSVADAAYKLGIKADAVVASESGKRVAIVGGGPAGLSAAYYARLFGHDVTVFDKQSKMGGMMRYGIPDYRLPQDVLDAEIMDIESIGVKLRTKMKMGLDLSLAELKEAFDAVFLSVGSWQATSLGIDGEGLIGVSKGIEFLERIAKGKEVKVGNRVIVIGGGNTAIDCARTALRLGAEKVTIVYRRSLEEMPAEDVEIKAAMKEGVEIKFLTAPVGIEGDGKGQVCGIKCIEMELGAPDLSGRRRAVQKQDTEHIIDATDVIMAVGQKTDMSFLWNDRPVKLNKWGDVEIDSMTMLTSVEKVFSGGDCVTGPATVIQAIAAGRQAAVLMNDYLVKGYIKRKTEPFSSSRGRLEDLPRYEFLDEPKMERKIGFENFVVDMDKPFGEVEFALPFEKAQDEAERCLSCGCSKRSGCSLRNEATRFEVDGSKFSIKQPQYPVMEDHPLIKRDTNKCISCGKCISICRDVQGVGCLDFYLKQGKLSVGTVDGASLEETSCVSCGQCVAACPCGALEFKRSTSAVQKVLSKNNKKTVAFVAPAVRSTIAKHYNLPAEKATPFIAGLLKKIGFDKVYDFSFAADLTIIEETNEFLKRFEKGHLPHFTSCCPGWVNHVEKNNPEIMPYLSSCKSPQQMMGALVKEHLPGWMDDGTKKEDLYVVSVVPCLAKKGEAQREEFIIDGIADVDAVLTTTELIEMADAIGLSIENTPLTTFNSPYKNVSGAGILFGMTGGVAEATLRMACEKENSTGVIEYDVVRGTEGLKTATVEVNGRSVRFAVVNGLKNVQPIIDELLKSGKSEFDLIEVMSCPGGCVSGAGHPVADTYEEIKERHQVLVDIDKVSKVRKSQDNPDLNALYNGFIGNANSDMAHKLFHTSYQNRKSSDREACKKSDRSAWTTRTIEVCICSECNKKGSTKLMDTVANTISEAGLEHFYSLRTVMMHGHTASEKPFVAIDGRKFDYYSNEMLADVLFREREVKR